MGSSLKQNTTEQISLWQVFRFIFVIFCMYLLGDAFYRWDGFRYYASFSEFLPNVALATLLFSFVALLTAFLIWTTLRMIELFFKYFKLKVSIDHLLLVMVFSAVLGYAFWTGKRIKFTNVQTTFQLKALLMLGAIVAAIFVSWMFRNKAASWMNTIHDKLTPLVWLFGAWAIISLPLVAYHVWSNNNTYEISKEISVNALKKNVRPNILLVTFDALTARNMSVYGYNRNTTPFIDEWGLNASVFTKAYSESNITTPSVASLMTGKRVWTHRTHQLSGFFEKNIRRTENIPALLKNSGYYNMAFVVNPHASVDKLGIRESFNLAPIETGFSKSANLFGSIDNFLYRWFGRKLQLYDWILKKDFILYKVLHTLSRNFKETEAPPEKAFNKFLTALASGVPEPYFAWIHVYPPHDPYLPPESFMGLYDTSPLLRTYKNQENIVKMSKKYRSRKKFPPDIQPDIQILKARYDEFIRYCDSQFKDFIEKLSDGNKLSNTVVILSSDHGESFEHGFLKHSFSYLYEQVTHIPLIIKEPDQTDSRVINVLSEQIDIPATILDFAGISLPPWTEGRSLLPLIREEQQLRTRPIFSMGLEEQASRGHQITNGNIAVWTGEYKLIHYLSDKRSELFNLKIDPGERINLFDEEPEVGKRLLGLIHDRLKNANERIATGK